MYKRILSILFICFIGSGILFAQYDYEDEDFKKKPKPPPTTNPDKKFDPKKLSIGGFFGAGFGDIVFVDISPVAMYRFHDRFAFGTGFIYQYFYFRQFQPPSNRFSTYGGRAFPRVFVWKELFTQLEYMVINIQTDVIDQTGLVVKTSGTFHNAFLGLGYNIPLGDSNSFMTILVSINLNENVIYPRRQPLVSFGFGIGL